MCIRDRLGSLKQKIVGGDPILSHTISLRTVESEIANSLSKVQDQNKDVEIGSYPYFHAGKLGVSIVLRSEQLHGKKDSFQFQHLYSDLELSIKNLQFHFLQFLNLLCDSILDHHL